MSSQAQVLLTPLPVGTSIPPGSLRAEMDARRASGRRFALKDALALTVPLCTQLARLHAEGKRLFVHPSDLQYGAEEGAQVVEERAHTLPALPRDRACLAPEERKGVEGDARASVFSIGAILYELLTNASVGPGMRRPSELVPDLPPTIEVLLGKALVADVNHRPADLGALAQALHDVVPSASVAPPAADVSHLDHDGDVDVDVSLSMLPPTNQAPRLGLPPPPATPRIQAVEGDGLYSVAIPEAPRSRTNPGDPTQRLSDMKAALESDPRPRYVVVKDGMDHGPFSAVELLQQIASGSFAGGQTLRDAFSGDERPIQDWEEFAPFAQQAQLNREIVQEKQAFEAVVVAEKKGTQYKALIGMAVIGVFAAMGAGWWYRDRANRQSDLVVQADRVGSIEVDAGLARSSPGTGPAGAGARPAGGGNYPTVAGGGSCEAAIARYTEEYKIGGSGAPDLTAGAYGNVLNRGSYLNACNVPSNMAVNICAAVQNGRAIGVTVSTSPSNPGVSSCVAGQVRALPFPSHPRLDVARTTFAGN